MLFLIVIVAGLQIRKNKLFPLVVFATSEVLNVFVQRFCFDVPLYVVIGILTKTLVIPLWTALFEGLGRMSVSQGGGNFVFHGFLYLRCLIFYNVVSVVRRIVRQVALPRNMLVHFPYQDHLLC